jgi:hypothetical protein
MVMAAMFLVTLVAIGMRTAWRAPLDLRLGGLLVASLVVVTLLGVELVKWQARINDGRSEVAEQTPLPPPADSALGTLGTLLVSAGPLVVGALLMLACREANRGRADLALLYVVTVFFVAYWAPWVVGNAFPAHDMLTGD